MFSKLIGVPARGNVLTVVFLLDVMILLTAILLDSNGLLVASLILSVSIIIILKTIAANSRMPEEKVIAVRRADIVQVDIPPICLN